MKRLIVCCDGTWQGLSGPYPTNVVKMMQRIGPVDVRGIPQLVYYSEGIGTRGSGWERLQGGAFGQGIDDSIQEAYRFLSANYEPGDEILLFGFSRGAYTVRSLAGMIYCSGLLRREHVLQAAQAYRLYRDRLIKPSDAEAIRFRGAFTHLGYPPEQLSDIEPKYHHQLPIKALCCWDTVGSLGIPNLSGWVGAGLNRWLNRKYQFHDTYLNRRIERGFHAVAIDERLAVFDVTVMQPSEHREPEQVKQCWFPGGHGCVGGGTEATRALSDGALQWMMDQVAELGLQLQTSSDPLHIDPLAPFSREPKGVFRLARRRWRDPYQDEAKQRPLTLADLHSSTQERWRQDLTYRPENLKSLPELARNLNRGES
jgi:uncharacterized protein (DUF2235 family)